MEVIGTMQLMPGNTKHDWWLSSRFVNKYEVLVLLPRDWNITIVLLSVRYHELVTSCLAL